MRPPHIEHVFLTRIIACRRSVCTLVATDFTDDALAICDQFYNFPIDGGQFESEFIKAHFGLGLAVMEINILLYRTPDNLSKPIVARSGRVVA